MVRKKRKILYISGTRADYGLIRETLFYIRKNPFLEVEIAATGMHLMPEFGKTINEVIKDGFKVYPVAAVYKNDTREAAVSFIADLINNLLKEVKKIKPDIIFVQGDRPEMLAGAIVGVYLGMPVCHSHGGEVTSTVDEITRHAISKLSHFHFAATKKSAERLVRMGEDPQKVFTVGALGIEAVIKKEFLTKKEIEKKYNLNLSEPFLLVLQHPVTLEEKEAARQIKETMEAVVVAKEQTIIIYPCSDAGSREIIKVVKKYEKYDFLRIYKNIAHKDFLSLMSVASVLIGNSSSGIIEAPSLGLPVINIGTRQEGREHSCNIINVGYSEKEIKKAIEKAVYDKKFREGIKKCKNPYQGNNTGMKIVNILSKIKIDKNLLQKKITY